MKPFGKTEDGVMDSLLRAYVSRPTNPRQVCPDFDPDLANAYLERGLTTASRSRFEEHLSECATCRKNVVALMRFAEADRQVSVSAASGEARAPWFSGAARVFGALTRPQWAMAAVAVLVLAVSLPVFFSSKQKSGLNQGLSQPASAERQSSEQAESVGRAAPAASMDASFKQSEASPSTRVATAPKQLEKRATENLAGNARSAGDVAADKSHAVSSDEPQKAEAKKEATDTLQGKTKSEVAAQPPAEAGAQAAGETQLAKTDAERGRQQEKDSARGSESKSSRVDESRRSEEVAAVPPPAASAAGGGGRKLGQPRAKLSLRDSRTSEAVRPAEKSIRGKKFLFKDDTWTDKDFNPDSDLPVVTIIRDSNVYKEVLGKRAGLKPFLTGFTETERAIIVYKGTVYKLIPQATK